MMKYLFVFMIILAHTSFAQNSGEQPARLTPAEAYRQFGQKVSQSDLDQLLKKLEDFAQLPEIELSVEDLILPTDDPALTAGGLALQERFTIISHEVAKMEMSAHRLNALLKMVPESDEKEPNSTSLALYQTQSELFQGAWHRVIRSLTDLRLDKTQHNLEASIQTCQTQACVATVGEAFKEMNRLGIKLNQDLDIEKLSDFNASFQFQNKYIRRTLRETVNHLVGVNVKKPAFLTLAKIAISPFVFATRQVHSFGDYFVQVFTRLKIERKKLFARAYQRDINRKGKLVDHRTTWASQVRAEAGALIKAELTRTGKNENASYDQDYQAALTEPIKPEENAAASVPAPQTPLEQQYPNIFISAVRKAGLASYFQSLDDTGLRLKQSYDVINSNSILQSEYQKLFENAWRADFSGKNDQDWTLELYKSDGGADYNYRYKYYIMASRGTEKLHFRYTQNEASLIHSFLKLSEIGICQLMSDQNPKLQSLNAFTKASWFTTAGYEKVNFSLNQENEKAARQNVVPMFYRCNSMIDPASVTIYVLNIKRENLNNLDYWFPIASGFHIYNQTTAFLKSSLVPINNSTYLETFKGSFSNFNTQPPAVGIE